MTYSCSTNVQLLLLHETLHGEKKKESNKRANEN